MGLNYIISLLRVKIVAVLLGPTGIGLVGLYTSATNLVSTVSGLGLANSAVRAIAQADAEKNWEALAANVRILRLACWVTGIGGWLAAFVLARPISNWVFGKPEHAVALSVLGLVVLLGALSGGEMAMLQGVRRIGDVARVNVLSGAASTISAIAIYAFFGKAGIIAVLIISAAISLFFAWWFARKMKLAHISVSLLQALSGARGLLRLGVALMWSGLMGTSSDILIRSIVVHDAGIRAAGYYQAAWALSGVFAGFVLSAMGTDFYPRLSGVISDRLVATRTVNEQTEVGVLLALPGLLATLAFAPVAIRIFYSAEFSPAATLLPWFLLGVFGKVISWPLGFIVLARGASSWYIGSETAFSVARLTLTYWLVSYFGIAGTAYAFAASYVLYTAGMLLLGTRLVGFRWSIETKRLLAISTVLICLTFALQASLSSGVAALAGAIVTILGSLFCLRGLAHRLGPGHWFVRMLSVVPGIRRLILWHGTSNA